MPARLLGTREYSVLSVIQGWMQKSREVSFNSRHHKKTNMANIKIMWWILVNLFALNNIWTSYLLSQYKMGTWINCMLNMEWRMIWKFDVFTFNDVRPSIRLWEKVSDILGKWPTQCQTGGPLPNTLYPSQKLRGEGENGGKIFFWKCYDSGNMYVFLGIRAVP